MLDEPVWPILKIQWNAWIIQLKFRREFYIMVYVSLQVVRKEIVLDDLIKATDCLVCAKAVVARFKKVIQRFNSIVSLYTGMKSRRSKCITPAL